MNPNYYKKQCERALKRKLELIELKGGKCQKCGYDKNIAALDFHHINPEEKSFQIDSRHLSNTHIDKLKTEVNKCILLCANCHRELHYEKYNKDNISTLLEEYNTTNNVSVLEPKRQVYICAVCGKPIESKFNKKYCSNECRYSVENIEKNYPTYEEITSKYEELKSWDKVAAFYGITRKITQGIRKRHNKQD